VTPEAAGTAEVRVERRLVPRGGRALEDATAVLERIRQDESAADAMRESIRRVGLPGVPHDRDVEPLLGERERVVAIRGGARIRPEPAVADDEASSTAGSGAGVGSASARPDSAEGSAERAGRLYLTTERLLLVGRDPLTVRLERVDELAVIGERLLVSLRDGVGFALDVSRPRELRVLISGALATVRD
jgi:hypothetical protein